MSEAEGSEGRKDLNEDGDVSSNDEPSHEEGAGAADQEAGDKARAGRRRRHGNGRRGGATAERSSDSNEPSSNDDEPNEDEDAPAEKPPAPSYVFLVVTSAIFLAMDLGSKAWAVSRLEGGFDKKVVVIEGLWHFNLAKNKGGAWGLLGDQPDHIRLPFFFLISAVAVAFIVSLYRKLERRQVALKWALPLVLGGALGNLADRVRHQHVIDFIDMFITIDGQQKHWPTYNVADIWIVAGVLLMAVDMFTPKRRVRRAPKARRSAESGDNEDKSDDASSDGEPTSEKADRRTAAET